MNYKAIVLMIAVLALGGVGTANGQFLRKLGKTVERAAERTVERRAERETEKNTDKALDKVFEPGSEEAENAESKEGSSVRTDNRMASDDATAAEQQAALAGLLGGASMDEVPDSYTFSYRATMEIFDGNKKEQTNVLYWLEPDATYFGTEVPNDEAASQVAVMDMELQSMIIFMDDNKQKRAMRTNGNQLFMSQSKNKTENDTANMQLTPIAGKTILGYSCKGFQIETDDGIAKVWVTDEAPVGMLGGMQQSEYIPKGLPDFGSQSLVMETEYTFKKGNREPVRMVCTELGKVSMAIHKADYETL